MSQPDIEHVNFNVGGLYYCVPLSAIRKYPGNFISAALKKEWNENPTAPLVIDRSGINFRYVVEFYLYGSFRICQNLDLEVLEAIAGEADYYNFPEMVQACVDSNIETLRKRFRYRDDVDAQIVFRRGGPLLDMLSELWLPCCVGGYHYSSGEHALIAKSTTKNINLTELLALATPIGSGVFEVRSELLSPSLVDYYDTSIHFTELRQLIPYHGYDLAVRKLLIHQTGINTSHFGGFLSAECVGTLLLVLDSTYQGGEVAVSQEDNAAVDMLCLEPAGWIAWYHGCSVRDSDVTQGKRVCLVFDVLKGEKLRIQDREITDRIEDMHNYPTEEGFELTPCDTVRADILTELDKLLAAEECDVVISLSQLYPVFLTTADQLTGADATLYKLLHDTGLYELTFALTTVRYGEQPPFTGFAVDTQYALTGKHRGGRDKRVHLLIPQCAYSEVSFEDPKGFNGYGRIRRCVGHHIGVEQEYDMYLLSGLQVNRKKSSDRSANVSAL